MSPIGDFPGRASKLVWSGRQLYFLACAILNKSNGSLAVYKITLHDGNSSRHAYGTENDATDLRQAGPSDTVQVQSGLADHIHFLDGPVPHDGKYELSSWDVIAKAEMPIVVLCKSCGSSPSEVYSVGPTSTLCQLSQHGRAVAELGVGNAQPHYYTASDGTELDGVLVIPLRDRKKPWKDG